MRLQEEVRLSSYAFRNTTLQSLDPELLSRLNLRPIHFELGQDIERIGEPITKVLFVEAGMASMTTSFQDGFEVEVTMFGYESIIGISALMGSKVSLNRVYTQIPGHGYSCEMADASREFNAGGVFRTRALQYVQAQLLQSMQSAACNVRHAIEKRLARWLLLCADRVDHNRFVLTQEYLSHMLGCNRATVSAEAARFKEQGLIEYTRGEIQLLDVPGLKSKSCECYGVIKSYLDDYAKFGSESVQ